MNNFRDVRAAFLQNQGSAETSKLVACGDAARKAVLNGTHHEIYGRGSTKCVSLEWIANWMQQYTFGPFLILLLARGVSAVPVKAWKWAKQILFPQSRRLPRPLCMIRLHTPFSTFTMHTPRYFARLSASTGFCTASGSSLLFLHRFRAVDREKAQVDGSLPTSRKMHRQPRPAAVQAQLNLCRKQKPQGGTPSKYERQHNETENQT